MAAAAAARRPLAGPGPGRFATARFVGTRDRGGGGGGGVRTDRRRVSDSVRQTVPKNRRDGHPNLTWLCRTIIIPLCEKYEKKIRFCGTHNTVPGVNAPCTHNTDTAVLQNEKIDVCDVEAIKRFYKKWYIDI